MKVKTMSSKERMLAAVKFQETDYIPCAFMIFTALKNTCKDEFEFVNRQLEFGLDAVVRLPDLTPHFHPDVRIKEWKEHRKEGRYPLLHREYHTPAGALLAVVRQDKDWPYGDHIPLFDDYVTGRSEKFLITERSDLKKLRYLLLPLSDEQIHIFRETARKRKSFAADKDLLLCSTYTQWPKKEDSEIFGTDYGIMGIDSFMWICGGVQPLYWAYDEPEFLQELIVMIADWNRRRMELYLDEGVELLIKRAWYESTEFWSPELYKKYIAPILKEDVRLTHQAGAKFGYIMTGGIMPLLDMIIEAGVDVNIGVDPVQGKGTDMKTLKEKAGGKMCLWGGVNGFLTVERGTEDEIKTAIEEAVHALSKNSGFILSPVDNVTDGTEQTWWNVQHFIKIWKELRNI